MKHTPVPWSINEWPQANSDITIGATGTPLIAVIPIRDVSINEQKENARRIVACVNACNGIPTEMLERHNNRGNCAGEIRLQRDELLAALQELSRYFVGEYEYDPRSDNEIDSGMVKAELFAKSVIAKATGSVK